MSRLTLFIFTAVTLASTVTYSDTYIPGGNVSGTWTQAGSPYLIMGEISVQSRDTLFVQPGVEVIFQGNYKFIIYGILNAEGTENDSILFTAANTFEGWHGFRFYSAPSPSYFSHCNIEYGKAIGSYENDYGGGIYCFISSPVIRHCTFRFNIAGDHGGAIYCDYSNPEITDCDFIQNLADNRGAGIFCYYSTPEINHCSFYQNHAEDDAGGIYLENSNFTIDDCEFRQNRADDAGGAIFCNVSHPVINGSAFIGNYAEDCGGAISALNSTFTLNKCTVTDNSSDLIGSAIYSYYASGITIINSIIWDNGGEAGFYFIGDPDITYSDIQGGWSGDGNIDFNPMFVDPAGGDFSLQCGSPCIDSGNPNPIYNNPDNTRSDMGAYYYHHNFQICPSLLDFGSVATGSILGLPLTITNVSDSIIILREFVTGDPCFATDFNPSDSLLLPADSLLVTVTFSPQTTSTYRDTLTIVNSSEDWHVNLQGEGMEGGTPVPGGAVSGTWLASGSPYWIDGEINIPDGYTLNIESGVEVIFQGHYKLIVNGILEAIGTETDSILFTAADTSIGWQGIRFIDAVDSGHLSYCNIRYGHLTGSGPEYSGGGICCINSNPVVNHCTIADCRSEDYGGGIACSASAPVIANSNISRCYSQAMGGGIYCTDYSTPRIIGNTIEHNQSFSYGGAISLFDSSAAYIHGNEIRNNQGGNCGGINLWASDAIVDGNIIIGNTGQEFVGGIQSFDSYSTISNNVIMDNRCPMSGGAIYVSFGIGGQSGTVIEGNFISRNYGGERAGGIEVYGTGDSQIISNNIICDNIAREKGGGIYCNDGGAKIIGNFIFNNALSMAEQGLGGGIYADPFGFVAIPPVIIADNTICGNSARYGGGVFMSPISSYALPTMDFARNIINGNTAQYGGGLYIDDYYDLYNNTLYQNTFAQNHAVNGGGIYMDNIHTTFGNNTLYGNSADIGAGIYCIGSDPTLENSIIWDQSQPPIHLEHSPGFTITYSDIEGGWEGAGNIDADPLFINIAPQDYRLQWGSPCIDSGNPWGALDPDSTTADMGAFYYDQSIPFRVLLTPHNILVCIPHAGGHFDYVLQATNHDTAIQQLDVWCDVKLPDGTSYGPVFGPVTIVLESGGTQSITRSQTVPAGAPWGIYTYAAYAATASDTSKDEFRFCKEYGEGNSVESDWNNQGESFGTVASGELDIFLPEKFALHQNYPNPFNQHTAISYQLSAKSDVNLTIYDIQGREVARLVDGYKSPGIHEVVFNAKDLSSGVYFARLEAGEFKQTQKMLLIK